MSGTPGRRRGWPAWSSVAATASFGDAARQSFGPVFRGVFRGTLVATLTVWILFGVVSLLGFADPHELPYLPLMAVFGYLATLAIAVPLTYLIAWPLYACLVWRGRASYPTAMVIAGLFVALAWWIGRNMDQGAWRAFVVLPTVCNGVSIAVFAHRAYVRSCCHVPAASTRDGPP